jgi:DNA-binding CsgD family transcriptional regulator
MLPGGYAVLQGADREEFRDEVVRFTQRLGFETVSAITVIDHGGQGTASSSRSTTRRRTIRGHLLRPEELPARSGDAALQAPERAHHLGPAHLRGQGLGELWEQQAGSATHRHRHGAAHARRPALRARRGPRPAAAVRPGELQRVVADLQLFAVHAQEAALRLLLPEPLQPEKPALTPRELEALRWTMEGKTAWEVGAILGISERTAVLHVNNAMHKLGCVSKHAGGAEGAAPGPDPLKVVGGSPKGTWLETSSPKGTWASPKGTW